MCNLVEEFISESSDFPGSCSDSTEICLSICRISFTSKIKGFFLRIYYDISSIFHVLSSSCFIPSESRSSPFASSVRCVLMNSAKAPSCDISSSQVPVSDIVPLSNTTILSTLGKYVIPCVTNSLVYNLDTLRTTRWTVYKMHFYSVSSSALLNQ